MSSSRTRRALVTATLAAILPLAACSGGSDDGKAAAGGNGAPAGGKSGSQTFGELPAESGTPKDGGTIDIAQQPGAGPYYVLPIVPGAFNSTYVTYQFQRLMYRPLYWFPEGASPKVNPALSLAELPEFSDDNKTVTIKLRPGYTWSDGSAVEAGDVVFFINLLKAALKKNAANWGGYTPGQFPDNVMSAKATSANVLTLKLKEKYNPEWFTADELTSVIPLPAKQWARASADGPILDHNSPKNAEAIYTYLDKASRDPASFATNPLWQTVNGPYRLSGFDVTTNFYSMTANEAYTGSQKPRIKTLNFRPFTSETAKFNQLLSGNLTMATVDQSHVGQVSALKAAGYNVYGAPRMGFNFIMLNFKDTTDNVDKLIGQLYIRQALQHLIDQPGYIASKGMYNGAAAESYGTAPASSPYASDTVATAPYPYDPNAARKLLEDHGWKVVPNGATTCERPGTGATECGAGIPQGQTIKFNLFHRSEPQLHSAVSTAFASEARKLGMTITVAPKTFSFLIQNYNVPAAPSKAGEWAMSTWGGFSTTPYPTMTGTFDSKGSGNVGAYDDPKTDELIQASVHGEDRQAVQAEIEHLRTDLPVLWLPNAHTIWAWKNTLSGPQDTFAALPTTVLTPEYWYLK
ncbi:ABC transporter substrate-binding protein [Streptosporangium sp. NBC_01756]|uniref:ABC transporter substrate-binding protein n=1 Tax=Streptosporangium sp. NBC_01756 TaxID=2975950 RepID=UPI002DD84DCF|nr:ABC transporter substrate-binding protein [Streptosporangium sp. NBC_01756]WSC88269.1 ABC transporter substrate-binding protein [Streptosporangium sp. NBC_01756]